MTNSSSSSKMANNADNLDSANETTQSKDSYVKLAMRNMVKKGGKSLKHFLLTTLGLVTVLIGLAYLTKP